MILPRLTPTKGQREAIDRCVAEFGKSNASANISQVGAGKTLVAVELARDLWADTVLVIAPLGTLPGWEATFARQEVELPFRSVDSTKPGKAALEALVKGERGVYFVGREMFSTIGSKTWRDLDILNSDGTLAKRGKKHVTTNGVWEKVKIDLVINDEAHRGGASGKGGKMYKDLERLKLAKYRHSLTGTPEGSSFEGAHVFALWLWPDIVDASVMLWKQKWCENKYSHFAYDHSEVVGEKNPGAFFASLPCVVDVPVPPIPVKFHERYVKLTAQQKKTYDELQNRMATWIEEENKTRKILITKLPIVQRTRLIQATLAEFSIADDDTVGFKPDGQSVKADELERMIEEEPELRDQTALIFTHSQKYAEYLVERLGKRYAVAEYSGVTSKKVREQNKLDFISGKIRFLVMVPQAGGTGVDGIQDATNTIIWMSEIDSVVDSIQGDGRVKRVGQKKTVHIWRILALDTYDVGILNRRLGKILGLEESKATVRSTK